MSTRARSSSTPAGTGFADVRPPWWLGVGIWIVAALAVLPYLNALVAGLVFDDASVVINHPAVQGPFNLITILKAPYWAGSVSTALWRPVTTLSFALDRQISGGGSELPHLVNILLHLGVTLLWYAVVKRLTGREGLSLVVAGLFAVHPIHTEAVTWVSGRAELLAAFFGLLAVILALHPRRGVAWWAPVALLVAVASKESVATLPAFLLVLRGVTRSRTSLPRAGVIISCAASVIVYVCLRRAVLGTWAGPAPTLDSNPLVGTTLLERLPTAFDLIGRYVELFVWPVKLSIDYSSPILNVVSGVSRHMLVGAGTTLALVALTITRLRFPEGWGSGFTLILFAVVSNIAVVIGTVFAERLTYLPSAGLLLVVCAIAIRLIRGRVMSIAGLTLLGVAIVAGATRTVIRNQDYRSNLALSEAGVRTYPRSWKMHYGLARELQRSGDLPRAVEHAAEAARLAPDHRWPREMYAECLAQAGRTPDAIDFLTRAIGRDPTDSRARAQLVAMLEESGRAAEADAVIESGISEDPEAIYWVVQAARRAQSRRDWPRAISLYRDVVARAPEIRDAPIFLGFCLLQAGDAAGAREAYTEALRRTPDSAAAANGLAWTLLETGGSVDEAIRLARRATDIELSAYYFDTLARACLAAGDCDGARAASGRAIELSPSDPTFRELQGNVEGACP